MKAIKTVLSLALIAMVMTLSSCASKSDNPADQFAASLDKLAEQVKTFTSENDFENLQAGMEAADKIVTDNAGFELTDNDRQTIKKALSDFYRTTMLKSFELAGQEVSEGQLDIMVNMIAANVDNMTTLGELNNPINNQNNAFVEEVEEEATEALSTDVE